MASSSRFVHPENRCTFLSSVAAWFPGMDPPWQPTPGRAILADRTIRARRLGVSGPRAPPGCPRRASGLPGARNGTRPGLRQGISNNPSSARRDRGSEKWPFDRWSPGLLRPRPRGDAHGQRITPASLRLLSPSELVTGDHAEIRPRIPRLGDVWPGPSLYRDL